MIADEPIYSITSKITTTPLWTEWTRWTVWTAGSRRYGARLCVGHAAVPDSTSNLPLSPSGRNSISEYPSNIPS